MKNLKFVFFFFAIAMIFGSCKKDEISSEQKKGTVQFKITDSRGVRGTQKDLSELSYKIVDPVKLTKFEITFSGIYFKDGSNNLIPVLNTPTTVDLRTFRGNTKDLLPVEMKAGKYTGIVIKIEGVNITYDNNNYSAGVNKTAQVTLGSVQQTISSGVPNPFATVVTLEIPYEFQVTDTSAVQGFRLLFDVETSCKEITINVPVVGNVLFAGLRDMVRLSILMEKNIQQIKHSPPLGITLTGSSNVNYYGLHTFVDFNGKGGVITGHKSQHVFRGEEGELLVDAELMTENTTILVPKVINATGETDVRADEVFKFSAIKANLEAKGYALQLGRTYYFSLRKIWIITSDGKTYTLSRMCEPIPVIYNNINQ